MADTPKQPATPARGTSPSPAIDNASKTSWDSWSGHGNKTGTEILDNKRPEVPVKKD